MTLQQAPVLQARNLRVTTDDGVDILHKVQFQLFRGEILGLVGESGAGKSTAGLACMAYYRKGLRQVSGFMMLNPIDGTEPFDLFGLDDETLRSLRGRRLAYVPPNPELSLNPSMRVGDQIREVLDIHQYGHSDADRRARVNVTLTDVGLPPDDAFQQRWPHELTIEQQQRVVFAMAVVLSPDVLILDESAAVLDELPRVRLLETIRRLTDTYNLASLYLTRDPSTPMALADRIAVMHHGEIVETGSWEKLFTSPEHHYTRTLMAAVPDAAGDDALDTLPVLPQNTTADIPDSPPPSRKNPWDGRYILSVEDLRVSYRKTPVLRGVNLRIAPGESTMLVGETGSGKTTLARAIVGLVPRYKGTVTLRGEKLAHWPSRRRRLQRRRVQYIFESPDASLNPQRTVGQSLAVPLETSNLVPADQRRTVIEKALQAVHLDVSLYDRRPAGLSAEQRQRAAIARALVVAPSVLICDDITASLDVSEQAAIIALLNSLRESHGLTILYLTRDIRLARHLATRIAVLHQGEIVEHDAVDAVLENPTHSYTQSLLKAHTVQR